MYAGILTAMLEKGFFETGFYVNFIEYANLSICFSTKITSIPLGQADDRTGKVSIAFEKQSAANEKQGSTNAKNKITCAVICDASDGQEFGQIVTQSVLSTFVDTYSDEFKFSTGVGYDFSSFNDKISEAFRSCVQPALDSLALKRGIENVVLISDNTIFSTGETLDRVGVLGNWEALANVTSEIMSAAGDSPYLVTLQNDNKRLVVRTIDKSTLVVSFRTNLNYAIVSANIEEAASLLAKILALRQL